uniref:Uncharacterized protein n=1 Tax=Xiphophorus maculatus TaxID=8083 RepID=A0A3B5QHZ6_XIPMA
MHDGYSPIIIDNTNLQAWEMKPYVKMVRWNFFFLVITPVRSTQRNHSPCMRLRLPLFHGQCIG